MLAPEPLVVAGRVFLPETLTLPVPDSLVANEFSLDPVLGADETLEGVGSSLEPLEGPDTKRVKLAGGGYRGANRKEYEPEEDRLILQLHAQ
jgi:hypothetical protein